MSRVMIDLSPTRFGMIIRPNKKPPPFEGDTVNAARNEVVYEFATTTKPGDTMLAPLLRDDAHATYYTRRRRWAGTAYWLSTKGVHNRVGAVTIDGKLHLLNKGPKP